VTFSLLDTKIAPIEAIFVCFIISIYCAYNPREIELRGIIAPMSVDAQAILEWTYVPKDFFEEPLTLPYAGGEIVVNAGKARGHFDSSHYDQGRDFRDTTHEFLHTTFLAQQVQIHLPFSLSPASMSREYADGRRDVTAFPESVRISASVGKIDFVIKDANGDIIKDSKAERLKSQDEFRKKVTKLLPTDLVLRRMIQSFNNGLADKDNMFIHLYEIRDTLATTFSGKDAARTVVNVSDANWRKFGKMTCDDPFLEGRHRGRHDNLRKASREDVDWVIKFSQTIIEGYVLYRDKNAAEE
jgi:hypothetical protein